LKLLKEEKKEKVEDIKSVFESGSPIIFADHSGINAENIFKIRNKLADNDAYIKIVKNTLALLAAGQVHSEKDLSAIFAGPTSMIVSGENIVASAKLVREFVKEFETFKVKGGIIENRIVNAEAIERLSSLPSKEVLIAQLLGMLMNPVTGLVTALGGVSRNLVVVLDAIRKQKEQAA
jgi:large subunit ribosomal protein L10